MTPECRHILRSGQKCRGAALQNQEFCRHHGPKSAVPGRPPVSQRDLYSRLARWRSFARQLAWIESAEIPGAVYEILHALTDRNPLDRLSPPVAGRYLHALLSRLGHVPFSVPDVPRDAPLPAPPLSLPHSRPTAVPPPSNLPPGVRAALQSIHQDTTSESIDALISSLGNYGVAAPGSSRR